DTGETEPAFGISFGLDRIPGFFEGQKHASFRRDGFAIREANLTCELKSGSYFEIADIQIGTIIADVFAGGRQDAFITEGRHFAVDVIVTIGRKVDEKELAILTSADGKVSDINARFPLNSADADFDARHRFATLKHAASQRNTF